MFGLLGPNGAGKSTLMRMIATLQDPDQGSIHLGKLDVLRQKDEVRKTLGYLPQEFGVYPKVSAEALLDYFALLPGRQTIAATVPREPARAGIDPYNLLDREDVDNIEPVKIESGNAKESL